ncbi:MAG: Malonyl CoA-acyl carrier protein transacylase [Candidatus Izimaplasma bacterium HR2]|nr:MAG: Malonyl CoA-acyl carrier protein transacylase [Candidatus Izimaplasma bacterium HR2]
MKSVLMFSGQGSQYLGMGQDLYNNYDVAKKVFDNADQILGYSIKDIMFNNEEMLNDTLYTQVAMFTLYVAILEVLKEKGVESEYAVGLSLGEYGALYYNDVFDFETGLKILEKRGLFMNDAASKTSGLMSAILGMETDVLLDIIDSVDGYVKIANYNTYGQLVISGQEKAVLEVNEKALENGAKRAITLNTSGPFHTDLMMEASTKFSEYLSSVDLGVPSKKLLVNTTGDLYQGDLKNTMVSQITNSVMFYQMIEKLIDQGVTTFIEVGPKKTLCSFVKKINRKLDIYNVEDTLSLNKLLDFLKEE